MGAPTPNQFVKIPVLDHGFVRLIDSMGSDLSIVRSARVSYNAAWRAGADGKGDAKLINYLMRNGHNTPFESVTITFEVKAPIFVFRQWHRHRTWSYNELSARYRELPEEFYIPNPQDIGIQSKSSKQARDTDGKGRTAEHLAEIQTKMMRHCHEAFRLYKDLLEYHEVPRELARSVLPLSTYSHMFGTVNLHNLFRFLGERLHPHAQWEIQEYAWAMLQLVQPIAPVAVTAWEKTQTCGKCEQRGHLSRTCQYAS